MSRGVLPVLLWFVLASMSCDNPNPCPSGRYDPGPPRRCVSEDAGTDADTWAADGGCEPTYADLDGDGYGDGDARLACGALGSLTSDDCDDTCAICNPAGTERCGGGDEDCDSRIDEGGDSLCFWACGRDGCDDPVDLVAGAVFACALRSSGSIACWGENANGQLGLGSFMGNQRFPRSVSGMGVRATALSAGASHVCSIGDDRSLTCWGANRHGQLGTGDLDDRARPAPVGDFQAAHIAAGSRHTCAIDPAGTVFCWGENSDGQLGLGTRTMATVPTRVDVAPATEICAGAVHTCVVTTAGVVYCWGVQTGEESDGAGASLGPVAVSGLADVLRIGCGGGHTCALDRGGILRCWGFNGEGQLGNGSREQTLTPSRVLVLSDVSDFALGLDHTCAVDTGRGFCWGGNALGQLGGGDYEVQTSPREVAGIGAPTHLTAGAALTCALSGDVWCWGRNDFGQIGDGTSVPRASPALTARPR